MKDEKFTNPDEQQEVELTEDQLDEVAGGAFGLAAADKDFDKKKLDLNPTNRASNPAELLPYIRNNTSRG